MMAKEEVKIRPMEPEDISGILEVDRKITGMQRALTYRDLVREALGGQIDMSFVAEIDDQFVGFFMAYLTYVRETGDKKSRAIPDLAYYIQARLQQKLFGSSI